MCEPVTITTTTAMYISLAMSAASAVAGVVAQKSASDMQDAQYEQNKLNAQQAFADNIKQTNLQMEQADVQEADKQNAVMREGARRRATATVAAGEAGVGGISVQNLMNDFTAAENRLVGASEMQKQWNRTGAQLQLQGAGTTMQSRINSVQRGSGVDYFGAALKLGGAAYDTYDKYNPPSKPKG